MKLLSFLSQPFTLLDNPKQKLILIGVCLGFGIIFANVFVPFNVNQWEQDSGIDQFLRLTSYQFIAAISLIFTQFAVRKVFKVNTFNVLQFLLWFLGEIIFISLIYLFVYSDSLNAFWDIFKFSFRYTLLGISMPYLLALSVLALISPRQLKVKPNLVGIPDEKGVVRVSLMPSSLLYIESADNYIKVFYSDEGLIKNVLIRNTLKAMETHFENTSLKRCHRSVIVNTDNIKLAEKKSGKLYLHIAHANTVIPVSRNFVTTFNDIISSIPK